MDPIMNTTLRRRMRALVLDDDAATRSMRRALESRHFSVLSAGDGTTGLALLLDELLDLDVLVMALDLPHRDARSFVDLIRRAGGERDLAIIVLATEADARTRAELLSLGVDALVDRSVGSEAAADAALDAVTARSSGRAPAAEKPASSLLPVPAAPWAQCLGRWSLLTA